jgi:hypothetical protein
MSRFLVGLLLLVIILVGVGYYLDWFHIKRDNADGKTDIQVTIDKAKIEADEKRAKRKIENLGHQADERVRDAAGNSHSGKS